jgi:site-specific recombinase XerD
MPHPTTHALMTLTPGISTRTRLAAAGYLARYSGHTLATYSISLNLYFRWLNRYNVDPLDVTRPQIELYVRTHLMQERGCSPATVHHHIIPVRGFYRFALVDELITRDPSLMIFLPKIFRDPWREDWLTSDEMRALVAAAQRSTHPYEHGLTALLVLLGLRISEALAVQIEDYQDTITGHRVLRLVGKGGKPATLPLSVAILRMLDTAADGRTSGHLLIRDFSSVRANVGTPVTYGAARAALNRLCREVGIERRITPHMARRGFVTHGLDQGVTMRDVQIAARHEDPRTTARYDRGAMNLDRSAIHVISASLTGQA